jgi:hypothetical protein
MKTPAVKVVTETVYEVTGPSGHQLDMRQVGSEWNDMIELRDATKQKLVLMRTVRIATQMMDELIKGDRTSEWLVIGGSPDLLDILGLIKDN